MKSPFPFKTLRTGLLLTYLALIVTSVGLLAWRVGASLDASRFAETQSDQEGRTILMAAAAEELIEQFEAKEIDVAMLQAEGKALADRVSQRVLIVDTQGKVLVDTEHPDDAHPDKMTQPEIVAALQGRVHRDIRYDADDGVDALYTAAPIWHGKDLIGVVRLELPMTLVQAASQQLWIRIIGASLLAVFATIIVSLWFAFVLTHPITQLTRAASALARGDLNRRVVVDGPEELRDLARSFNGMAERISKVMNDQRAFVANAAHELRTPLTNIRLRVEMLRDGAKDDPSVADQFLADIEGETARLATLVDELLDLSRIETGLLAPRREPVALQTLARQIADEWIPRAAKANVRIALDAPANLPAVNVDPDHIRRVLINLIDNALKFTPANGAIEIRLARTHSSAGEFPGVGDWIVMTVRDTGVGIAAEDLPLIFERFYRGDKARTRATGGTGLGLAIVKSIIDAHAGQLHATSEIGTGTEISFALPVAK
ncbi:MAG: HAMP domain-containing protein [Chloroflexi bacterium]|nr:HAMP domain-containing protein [Chloroflexota bacterium]